MALYAIAEYDKAEKRYSLVRYETIEQLASKLGARFGAGFISKSTLYRVLNAPTSSRYWNTCPDGLRLITDITVMPAYLRMSETEINLLAEQKSAFLAKYLFYAKYYASAKASDYTAKQFLAHSGLCVSSHKHASKVSECNRILAERGLLLISPLRDENKHRRNLYCYVG